MKQSREEAYAEVVGILANGVNKGDVFKDLVTRYPEVFLSIYDYSFHPVTFDKDIPPTPEPEIRYEDRVVETRVYPEELPESVPCYYNDLPGWVQGVFSEHLKFGRKIQAIKKVREYTGAGLRDSKDYVDKLQERFCN